MVTRHADLALTDEDVVQWSPAQLAEKERQLRNLAAASPQRGIAKQSDETGLALFAAAEPTLL